MFRTAALLLISTAFAETTRPVDKVIDLLSNLKQKVEEEGNAEASTYDAFACFCRDTTDGKSTSITDGKNDIETTSGEIEEKTALREVKISDMGDRKKNHEQWTKEHEEVDLELQKAHSDYNVRDLDLQKALSSLSSAIQAMVASKPSALLSVHQDAIKHSLALAEVLGLIAEAKRKEVVSFLQGGVAVDPDDAGYKFHSQGIIDILKKLESEFQTHKEEADDEWTKTENALSEELVSLSGKLGANTDAMGLLDTNIIDLAGEIASARGQLLDKEALLKDDQLYLKDLTLRCESRAKNWDQRSQLRADELTALTKALEVLSNEVHGRDIAVNNRTVLLEHDVVATSPAPLAASVGAEISKHTAQPSFLQATAVRSLLRGAHTVAVSAQARKEKAVAVLRDASQRLHSTALSTVALRVAEDPFEKVKGLIQKLIERLLREATMEATKKGFCDEQLGKAEQDRDNRRRETHKLNVVVKDLEIKEDELVAEIQLLTEALFTLNAGLESTTEARNIESTENIETIKTAKEGFAAVQEAITILKVFYKQAAKANVFLQASPVDEDISDPFVGAYQGKQEQSKGIIGMLQVIESDFDRTARVTKAAEKQAHAEFVDFDRTQRADISGKETKKTLDEEDLLTTRNAISQKMDEMRDAQSLLDDALKVIEGLKPTCIDTGMSYQDRVSKREEEIAALKRAVCILDVDSVEAHCGGASSQSY